MRVLISIIIIFTLSLGVFAQNKKALLVVEDYSPEINSFCDILRESFSKDFKVDEGSFDNICDFNFVSEYDLFLIPNAEILPAQSMNVIYEFLKLGKDIVSINGPLWEKQSVKFQSEYISKFDYEESLLNHKADNIIFDFSDDNNWNRSCSPEDGNGKITVLKGQGYVENKNSMKVEIENFYMWDSYINNSKKPFVNGASVFEIVAKGSDKTEKLAIECTESDSSRWIATIPLTKKWKRYFLKIDDFKVYTLPAGIQRESKVMIPENVSSISIGLALTHMSVPRVAHEYEVSEIATSKMTSEIELALNSSKPIAIDTLSAGFNFHPVNDVGTVILNKEQSIYNGTKEFSIPKVIEAVNARAEGHGFDKNREWRFINLLEAYSPIGEWRGVLGSMKINNGGDFQNSIFVSIPSGDYEWLSEMSELFESISKNLSRKVFLIDGGANFYTYFDGQDVILGATVANLSNSEKDVILEIGAAKENLNSKKAFKLTLNPHSTEVVSFKLDSFNYFFDGEVFARLVNEDGEVFDNLSHKIDKWLPKENKEFVKRKNGEWFIGNERFRPYGTNYISTAAAGSSELFAIHHPFSNIAYDPKVTKRDIDKMVELGFNSVSLFIFKEHAKEQNLLNTLKMLEAAGIKANLALRPGTPMDDVISSAKEIIEYYKLYDNDTIWAYDLAWEPVYGNYYDRKIWDKDWEKWIKSQYGSIELAEVNWEISVLRDSNGNVTCLDETLLNFNEGSHTKMSVAYRRFLDFLSYKKYNEARRLVREIDSNHQIAFRMCETSNPFFINEGKQAYDFNYLSAGVDFLAPEGYGRIGEWERVKPGFFIRSYGKWAAEDYPLIWAEVGSSIWDIQNQIISDSMGKDAENSYRNFMDMLVRSGSDGVYFWYMCPGLRVDEASDYGIINQDFTDRRLTKVIREYRDKVINGKTFFNYDVTLEIKTDTYASGIAGIYKDIENDYWNAVNDGKLVALKTIATGTNTDNVPMISIDGLEYNGSSPFKFVDGAFDYIEIISENKKHRILNESILKVGKSNFQIVIDFTNLNEAMWLKDKVLINLTNLENGKIYSIPISKDIKRHESGKIVINANDLLKNKSNFMLEFQIKNKAKFGEKVFFTLEN